MAPGSFSSGLAGSAELPQPPAAPLASGCPRGELGFRGPDLPLGFQSLLRAGSEWLSSECGRAGYPRAARRLPGREAFGPGGIATVANARPNGLSQLVTAFGLDRSWPEDGVAKDRGVATVQDLANRIGGGGLAGRPADTGPVGRPLQGDRSSAGSGCASAARLMAARYCRCHSWPMVSGVEASLQVLSAVMFLGLLATLAPVRRALGDEPMRALREGEV